MFVATLASSLFVLRGCFFQLGNVRFQVALVPTICAILSYQVGLGARLVTRVLPEVVLCTTHRVSKICKFLCLLV